jgi:hypothetical protein
MAALLLCELPAGSREARSWILGQVTLLASRAEADLKFMGSEQGQPGEPSREMLAIEVASIDLAHSLRSTWQSDGRLSSIDMRVLRLHTVPRAEFSAALFP